MIAGLVLCAAASAKAQLAASDPDTPQVVGLFQTCMRFAGNATELRDWIAVHHLPPVPEPQASWFLGSVGSGQVFGASTTTGKHALITYDSGTCQVVAMAGNLDSVQQALLASLARQGVAVTPSLERSNPDNTSTQHMFRADFGQKHWLLSITSKPHTDAPSIPPELHLMASIARGTSTPTR